MQVISAVEGMLEARARWDDGTRVGLVPTMGYLHAGHLSLVRQARAENDVLLASIFVNPTQFGPHEDLTRYPRDLPRDLSLLEECGVDAVFTPTPAEMYPAGFVTYVEPTGALVESCEGASRPGHFRGVATVVLKLFQLTRPHHAYFGQKDAQQVAVISRMVLDLNLPVNLRIQSTIRESDGLALSSRNVYLASEARRASTILYRALLAGQEIFDRTPIDDVAGIARVRARMEEVIATEPLAALDYADVRDPLTFLPLQRPQTPALLLIAATVAGTRLIDNFLLRPDGSWEKGRQLS